MKLFHKLNGKWSEVTSSNGGGEGIIGKDGKSAYEIAKEYGFEGSEEEWLTSLKGSNGISYNDIDYTKVITQKTQIYSGTYPGVKFTATNDGQALARIHNAGSTSTTQNYSLWIIDNTIGKSIGGGCFILNHSTNLSFPVKKGHVYLIQSFSAVSMNVLEVFIHPYKDNNLYSTEEQVIGTWIDGRPIYRKTVSVTSAHGVPVINTGEIDKIINHHGYFYYSDSQPCVPVPIYVQSNYMYCSTEGNNNIVLYCSDIYSSKPATVTVEYTKTTDIV